MASSSEVTHSKRPHVKTERMQEFIRAQDESNSPTKKLKCPEENCNKVFTSTPGLKYHLLTHTEKQPQFSCRKCQKVFKSANGLKYHREKTRCDDSDIEYLPDSYLDKNEGSFYDTDLQCGESFGSLPKLHADSTDLGSSTMTSGSMDKLRELAIIATGPQSPLLEKWKPPWDTKPSGCVKRSLEKMLGSCEKDCHVSSETEGSSNISDLKSLDNQHTSSFERELDGSDPHVSSSSPLLVSPDETNRRETSTWSHTWPTPVWQCFIKGTKIKFLSQGDGRWQLAELIAQKEELNEQASLRKTSSVYAPNGLQVVRFIDDDINQPEMSIYFTPGVLGQQDISVLCQRDHPFFVRDKGWSSSNPFETVIHYGIPCCDLSVGDICLPPSHPEAASSEEIFKSFEEFDFTPEDTSAVFALSSMKQQKKDADISPPAGTGVFNAGSSIKDHTLVKAKRPMNAFLLFAKEFRMDYTHKYPKRDNRAISVMLGEQWQALSTDKKRVYEEKARWLAEKQKKIHPDCWKRKKQP